MVEVPFDGAVIYFKIKRIDISSYFFITVFKDSITIFIKLLCQCCVAIFVCVGPNMYVKFIKDDEKLSSKNL